MKTYLITGANAMDSKELTHILLKRGARVVLTFRRNTLLELDRIRALFIAELITNPESRLEFELCDITDQNSVNQCIRSILQKYGSIEHLYLIAAMTHVGDSFNQKEYSILANGQSYYYFLDAIKNHTPSTRVYGAMTSELAGNVEDGFVFSEKTTWNPKSPYSYGKELGARWIQHYREATDCNLYACFGILFNHSSCYRTTDFFIRRLTNSFAKIALGKQKTVEFGFLDFWRDEGYSSFYAEMMIKMLENPRGPVDYVIATGQTHHAEEYLDLAAKHFNLRWQDVVKVEKSRFRPREVKRLIGDSIKAQNELDFRPNRMSFQDHMKIMCQYDYELESGANPSRPDVFALFP